MLPELHFHHIGIVTSDIAATAAHYQRANYALSETVLDPIQKVRIAFLSKAGEPSIELIEPADENSSVQKVLRKNGVSPYHMCYTVNDIEEACERLQDLGYVLLFRPVEAEAFEGKSIAYLYHTEVGFIELLQA